MEKSKNSRRKFIETTALGAGFLAITSSSLLFSKESAVLAPVIKNVWNTSKGSLMEFANVMPDGKYDFKPTEEVFSFSEQLLHLARSNYWCFSSIKGERSPKAQDAFNSEGKTKKDVINLLKESFAYGDGVISALTEKTAAEEISMGRNKLAQWKILLFGAEHITHHRGQIVVYLRLNGITPPQFKSGFFG
jgi:uncharacterized damage-inducible protein DinB